jgi:pteridine reductase
MLSSNNGYYMQKNSPRVALITGAARRIGAEIASYLHEKGLNVVLHYHTSTADVEQLCAALNQKRPHSAAIYCANLTDTDALAAMIEAAVSVWGHLDLLVNNASRFYKTEIGQITEFSWDDLMSANVRAPLFLSQAAVPHLIKTQGCIVNITDIHGDRPMRDYCVYSMSKAALIMLTKSLAKELGPSVRVNAISPGEIIWPEGDNELTSQMKEKIISRTALHRHGDPLAIAKAVFYLLNDAEYVTGHVLTVDGGRLLSI